MNLPLHERIRSEMEAEILSGALKPGERLPTEQELMQRYGCSRMTVNKALSALASAGLVDRRKRAGSFVARPRVHSMVRDIPDLEAEIVQRGQGYRYDLLSKEIRAADPLSPLELAVAGSGQILQLEGIHHADGTPLAVEERLISLGAVPETEAVDFTAISPGAWLLRHVPWTEAETRIAAVPASATDAQHLAVPASTPCLLIERRTWRTRDSITFVRQLFVGSSYDLVARFGPSRNVLA